MTEQETIYTGYALTTEQHGYVVVAGDWYSHGLCYWPCSKQDSPAMDFDADSAERKAAWLNTNFAGIGAAVKPLRYSNGEWIDQP